MKREASDRLDDWLKSPERKPLVIRGARQVGKTWIVRDLAERAGLKLIEINFDYTPELSAFFTTNDPRQILRNLSAETGETIAPEKSLLFLDEIQAAPNLFSTLRWFKEKMPELPVVCAGSLLDFVLDDHSFSMPVGRIRYFYLEPFSFLEFVLATGNAPLYQRLKEASLQAPLPEPLHKKCLELYRIYCLCGGMPEAVTGWTNTQDFNACLSIQQDLLNTYRDDFSKYCTNSGLLRAAFKSAAAQLGNKFVLGRVAEGVKAEAARKALHQLTLARIVSRVEHSTGNGLPLGAGSNKKFFKAILLDIGLVSSQLGLGKMPDNEINRLVFNNIGALAEQFAGQQIRYALAAQAEPELYYWQRTGGRQGELDYLIQSGAAIVPVEVKSGSAGAMKSLHQFMFDKQLDLAVRLDTNNFSHLKQHLKTTQGDEVEYTLNSIPVYLAERILELT